ncbi:tyrosine-protein phosphatase [Flavobacterium sp.]|uniref:tyrosine-protein phosphatase n=1 Tax=Flavobacterium sp. TaxID=239 RepID=UPI002FDC83CE
MISFFKTKPVLADLIPDNHVDIHSHLIPGVDDGAKNIEETLSLLQKMANIGFKNSITTPHIITNIWNNTEADIVKRHQEILPVVQAQTGINQFNVGIEYMLDDHFLKRLAGEKLLTLKDNYILVEMSYLNPPIQLFEIIFEIHLAGYKPILAHPERYLFYHRNTKELDKLKNTGCLFQLNLLATVDYYGTTITKMADKLLHSDYYDFVGSDIHHQNHVNAFDRKVQVKNTAALEKVIQKNLFFLE